MAVPEPGCKKRANEFSKRLDKIIISYIILCIGENQMSTIPSAEIPTYKDVVNAFTKRFPNSDFTTEKLERVLELDFGYDNEDAADMAYEFIENFQVAGQ
jgi:hypothetical protein